jgi:DNA repair protein RecO (recombination protein O)
VIARSEAIVLQSRKFRESSRIVTLYTREHGKIGVVARGATRAKSPMAAALQPMSYITAMMFVKGGRELQNLTGAESVERFIGISRSLERMTCGLSIIEIVNAVVHEEDRNDQLFDAMLDSLRALNAPECNESAVLLWFMVQLSSALGYAIRTDGCGVCDEPFAPYESDVFYSLAIGAPLCSEHREGVSARTLSTGAFKLLRELEEHDCGYARGVAVDRRSCNELLDALNAFIRYHVDGMRRLNVQAVSARMLGDLADTGMK